MSRLGDRVVNMVTRGIVRAFTATARGLNKLAVELLADEAEAQHFTIHGLASVPQAGADVLALQMSGNADHIVALVSGRGPALDPGEVALYNDQGWVTRLQATALTIEAPGGTQTPRVTVTATQIHLGYVEAPTFKAVARVGDGIIMDEQFVIWITEASARLTALTPTLPAMPSVSVAGTIVDGSTKVFAE